jgi:squalene synthase HpnC
MMATAERNITFDDRLLEAPSYYRTPVVRPTLEHAREWCKYLATTHYENFHVATFLLPKKLKPHFYSVYAFCRTSDDLGDEVPSTTTATELLHSWRAMLEQCFTHPEASRHPVFVSLQPTIAECSLPMDPFSDLITAFEQDQVYTHHASLKTLEEYSRCSANPVGRLVLLVSGYRDEELMRLSDNICTGLQLANFYQDVVEDWARGRRYLPEDVMAEYDVTDEQIADRRYNENFRAMMKFLVDDARNRLIRGQQISELVDRDLGSTLSLFAKGGHAILDAIASQEYNTLRSRPVVSKTSKFGLLVSALIGKAAATLAPRREGTR